MKLQHPARGRAQRLAGALALLLAGCGSSASSESDGFAVVGSSVAPGDTWKLNRAIDVEFNEDVDFSTVSLNTIQLTSLSGGPTLGRFQLLDPRTVRFLPACPTEADSSDAGLAPGRSYLLNVLASQAGAVTVRSTSGEPLRRGRTVDFHTPASEDPRVLFADTVSGPPTARLRGRAGVAADDPDATYLELGGDAAKRVYFEWDGSQGGVLELPGFDVPINHYSIPENRIAVVLHVNQPVSPDERNVSSELLRLEYRADDRWVPIPSDVELLANCTDTGAVVRITPRGLLPQGRELRLDIRQGFSDLTGDRTPTDVTNLATMRTAVSFDPGTSDPGDDGDEVLEPFLVGAEDDEASLEDRFVPLPTPRADWGRGRLQSAFDFAGTGGPGGNFDWHLPFAQDVVLDTTIDQIVGGPGGAPVRTQTVIHGVVDIRNLVIPATSTLVINGPNPCTILASGTIDVYGTILVSGASAKSVDTLGTTNQPEPGAAGQGGGGRGGTGSYLTTQSTPRGGSGTGAYGVAGLGGQGGETGYGEGGGDIRRGAGGGGAAFGPDCFYRWSGGPFSPGTPSELVRCQELIGMDAEPGFGGGVDPGRGAESKAERAAGGRIGAGIFYDDDGENDFLGTLLTADGRLVIGELDRLWAGGGGGAGGDAVTGSSFPRDPFTVAGDEKGAGGGGGAGGLALLAIGEITLHPGGRIVAEGGQGGGGEDVLRRIGGGSGGGAGGHVVLSSANHISISGYDEVSFGTWYHDLPDGHQARAISVLGGGGGTGHNNKGGSELTGVRIPWRCDAIPNPYYLQEDVDGDGCIDFNPPGNDIGESMPDGTRCEPLEECQEPMPDRTDPLGTVLGCGGDGGPGLIQLHVSDPALDLRFPELPGLSYGIEGPGAVDASLFFSPPPVGWNGPEVAAHRSIPFFGALSTAQSKWIPLGLARLGPEGETPVRFFFDGTDPADGSVLREGGRQRLADPILGPAQLGAGEPPYLADERTIVFDASRLADDVYARNPNLTRLFSVKLEDGADPGNFALHSVESAAYDAGTGRLRLTVSTEGPALADFGAAGAVAASLIPNHFLVSTSGEQGSYPDGTLITVGFEATTADAEGNPSAAGATGFVTDIGALTDDALDYRFFRFRIEFNLDTEDGSVDLSTPRPSLFFFRVPFRF